MTEQAQGLTLTVKKAMDILDCLGRARTPLAASELGRRLEMPRSTAYRLLTTLSLGGYVTQDLENPEKYRLGFKIVELASSLLDSIELQAAGGALSAGTQGPCQRGGTPGGPGARPGGLYRQVGMLTGGAHALVHRPPGFRTLHLGGKGDARLPARIGRSEHHRATRPACSDRPIPSPTVPALHRELDKVRRQGYAIDDLENEEGIRCVGAAILNHEGQPVAALSVSGPAFRLTLERAEELGPAVRMTAQGISRQLGYRGRRVETGDL